MIHWHGVASRWRNKKRRSCYLCNVLVFCSDFLGVKIELFNPLGRLWPRRHTYMKNKNQSVSFLFVGVLRIIFRKSSHFFTLEMFYILYLLIYGLSGSFITNLYVFKVQWCFQLQSRNREMMEQIVTSYSHLGTGTLQYCSHSNNDWRQTRRWKKEEASKMKQHRTTGTNKMNQKFIDNSEKG